MVPTAIGTGDTGGTPVTLVTSAETVVVSSTPVPMPNQVTLVVILASASWTAGTGITGMNLRIRRGTSVTDPQVGTLYDHAAAAGADNSAFIMATDQVDNGYQETYSLTLEQTAASANGTVNQASILVITF